MTGALIQLVAKNEQDAFLIENPEITFFKLIYRRYSNFVSESLPVKFKEPLNFGSEKSITLSNLGDAVSNCYLHVKLSDIDSDKKLAWARYLGYVMLDNATLLFDGIRKDRRYGEQMYAYSRLAKYNQGLEEMIGFSNNNYNYSNHHDAFEMYIPINMWFNSPGTSLPLSAMQLTNISLNIKLKPLSDCLSIGPTHSIVIEENISPFQNGDYIEQTINGNTVYGIVMDYDILEQRLYYNKIRTMDKSFSINSPIIGSINNMFVNPRCDECDEPLHYPTVSMENMMYVNVYYLSSTERERLLGAGREFLVTEVQANYDYNINSSVHQQNLPLIKPVYLILFMARLNGLVGSGTINDHFNWTDSHLRINGELIGKNIFEYAQITLSDQEDNVLNGDVYDRKYPYDYFTYDGSVGLNLVSYSLHPENYQPSGDLNASAINNIGLYGKLRTISSNNTCDIHCYAYNYNKLHTMYGIGNLAY